MAPQEKKEGILNYILNNKYLRFILIYGLLGLFITTFIYINPWSILENHNTIVFLSLFIIILLVSSIFYFIITYKELPSGKGENKFIDFFSEQAKKEFFELMKKVLIILACIIGIVCIIIFIFIFVKNSKNTVFILKSVLLFLIITIMLGIIYIILEVLFEEIIKNNKSEKKNFFQLIKDIIFFIPCLIVDFIKYLEHELSITTSPIWILLIIEIILIFAYFYLPVISKKIITNNSVRLLEGPIYTNNEIVLGNFQNLKGDDNFNYNYTISLDIWINPQPSNTNLNYNKYSSLFNYANKPNILYNGQTNTLRIIYQNQINEIETIYESNNFPYQSWINFVIILRASTLDIFINKKLVATVENILPYMKNDFITAGKNDGINGGIKNILYYNRPLDFKEI